MSCQDLSSPTVTSPLPPEDILPNGRRSKMEKILLAVLQGKTLAQAIDAAYNFLGNPPNVTSTTAIICTPKGKTLANSSFIDMIQSVRPEDREIFTVVSKTKLLTTLEQTDTPLMVECFYLGLRLIADKITWNDKAVAIFILPESEQPFGEDDAYFVHAICRYISHNLNISDSMIDFSGIYMDERWRKIIETGETEPEDLSWQNRLKKEPDSRFCVSVLTPLSGEHSPEQLCGRLRSCFDACSLALKGQNIVALFTVKNAEDYVRVREKLRQLSRAMNVQLSCSSLFSDPEQTLSHWKQANHLAASMNALSSDREVFEYGRHFTDVFLYKASHHLCLTQYVDDSLYALAQHDSACGTELYNTLFVYLLSGANSLKSSECLGIHRNTLAQRVVRIENILGKSLEDGEYRNRLLLCMKILKLQNGLMADLRSWT